MKKAFIVLLFLALYFGNAPRASGQERLTHPKKIYTAPDGKIYINKHLALYLWISSSPEPNAQKFRLFSERSAKYTNPFFLDTEGMNTIRTPWAVDTVTKVPIYPQEEIVFEVYADGIAPRTTVQYKGGKMLFKDGKVFLSGNSVMVLSAHDGMSGVEQTLYSIDGGTWKKYDQPISFEEEKEYQVRFYSVDNVGNVESIHSVTIVFDKSGPTALLRFAGDTSQNIFSGHASIRIMAEDGAAGIAGIYYSIDSGDWRTYEYPVQTKYLRQGEHTLRYAAKDNLENYSDTIVYCFYVDKTPPIVVQEFIGKSFLANGKEYASGKTLVKLTAFDNKSGIAAVYYSVNGEPYEKYEKPFYPPDEGGNMKITFYAIDKVGNKSEIQGGQTAASAIPYVDLLGPSLRYDLSGPRITIGDTLYIGKNTKIRLTGKDTESGMNRIEYRIDDSEYQTYTAPFSLFTEGRHTVHFVGYDQVDNTNQLSFVAMVDTAGPVISILFGTSPRGREISEKGALNIYPVHTVIFTGATDLLSGVDKIQAVINNTTEKISTGIIGPIDAPGRYTLTIKAIDRLGNVSIKEESFLISALR
ncbi:MAG: OmpL47-type beta-barrel domain-containing protein [Bacteroidales bacterium]